MDDAKSIYKDAVRGSETRSAWQRTSLFQRDNYSVQWNDASIREGFTKSMVVAPVESDERYVVKMHDGQGYYLTESFHSIAVARTKGSGVTGVFNFYYIPLRSDEDGIKDGDPHHHHHDNYMELATTLDGTILELRKYTNGRSVHYSVRKGDHDIRYIKMMLGLYLQSFYIVPSAMTKSGNTVFTCPVCGEVLTETAVGYVCWSCGWNEYAGYDGGDLNPGVIVGDRDNTILDDLGDLIGGDNGDVDDGSDGTGNNPGGGFNGDVNVNAERDSVLNKFTYNHNSSNKIRPTMEILWEDCLGQVIINNVSSLSVAFEEELSMDWIASFRPESNRITYYTLNESLSPVILIEELFHGLQKKNNLYSDITSNNINVEVEAKIVAYLYAVKHNLKDHLSQGYRWWDESIGVFINRPSETNYQLIVDAMRSHGYPADKFPDAETDHITDNLLSLASCGGYTSTFDLLMLGL